MQPTLGETGALLARRMAWSSALRADGVAGYIDGSGMTLVNRTDDMIDVPVSLTGVDGLADGASVGWTPVSPGETRL